MTPPRNDAARRLGGPQSVLQQDTTARGQHITTSVRRLRLTARCLDLWPVFVCEAPLIAELFDARGEVVELWNWGLPC